VPERLLCWLLGNADAGDELSDRVFGRLLNWIWSFGVTSGSVYRVEWKGKGLRYWWVWFETPDAVKAQQFVDTANAEGNFDWRVVAVV